MGAIRKAVPLMLGIATLMPPLAAASERCDVERLGESPSAVNLRIDNDLLGSGDQDQGYTNGAVITLVSPDLVDYINDPCLPKIARWLNSWIDGKPTSPADQKNMVLSIGQSLYTPQDWVRSNVINDDRPYAAIVMTSFGYNIRRGSSLRTTQLRIGVVGPIALGEEAQDAVHGAIGDEKFSGWDNQLRNEPLVGVVHERMAKHTGHAPGKFDAQWDVISHWGGSLGNAFSHANAGAELRLGWNLPDDFGSTPTRPAGENTAPGGAFRPHHLSGHVFLTSDVRWVVRDITLDGNTFRSSHRVDKRSVVGEVGFGVVLSYGRWKFALARYYRTREFDGQADTPVFGSFTISRML